MDQNMPFGLGAHESPYDVRTWKHDTTLAMPLVKGGYVYAPADIEHQHFVGICTGISLTQNAGKALGKKFSADFQYLLQKKYYDLNWAEGSSIFNALKVGKNYGFLRVELFTWVTEQDRFLPYNQYIAKLQAVPDAEIARLLALCTDKLAGYAQLEIDSQSLAKGILDSKAGILTRYVVGNEWWTAKNGQSSYDPKDIDPLRSPANPVSGHAIGTSYFDYSAFLSLEHPNTWGTTWDMQGRGHTDHAAYSCTEAWIPYYASSDIPKYQFLTDMKYGQTSDDIKKMQALLGMAPEDQTGYFGPKTRTAVIMYQDAHHIFITWLQRYFPWSCVAGPMTRAALSA